MKKTEPERNGKLFRKRLTAGGGGGGGGIKDDSTTTHELCAERQWGGENNVLAVKRLFK